MTRMRHECYTNVTSATRVKNFDFRNDASENIFSHLSHPFIYYMASERLYGEEQLYSKSNFILFYYLLEMTWSHAKMHLKSAAQKRNFVMGKVKSKSCIRL